MYLENKNHVDRDQTPVDMMFSLIVVILVSLVKASPPLANQVSHLLCIDDNLLRNICEYEPAMPSLLRLTCNSLKSLPRDFDEASWNRLNLPRFRQLPYHPAFKAIQNFPPLRDADDKVRFIFYLTLYFRDLSITALPVEEELVRLMVEEIVAEGSSFLRRLLRVRAADKISWRRIDLILCSLVKREQFDSAMRLASLARRKYGAKVGITRDLMNRPEVAAYAQENPVFLLNVIRHPEGLLERLFEFEEMPMMLIEGGARQYGRLLIEKAKGPRIHFKNVPLDKLTRHLRRFHDIFAPVAGANNPIFKDFVMLLKVRGILPYDLPSFPNERKFYYLVEAIDFHNGHLLFKMLPTYSFQESDHFPVFGSDTLDFLHDFFIASPREIKEKLLERSDLRAQDRRFVAAFHGFPSMRAFLHEAPVGSLIDAARVLVKDGLRAEIGVLLSRMTARDAQEFVITFILHSGHSEEGYGELVEFILGFPKHPRELVILQRKLLVVASRLFTAALKRPALIPLIKNNHWRLNIRSNTSDESLIRTFDSFNQLLHHFSQQVIGFQAYPLHLTTPELVKRMIIVSGLDTTRYFREIFSQRLLQMSDYSFLINLSVYGRTFRELDSAAFKALEVAMMNEAAYQDAFDQILQRNPSISRYLTPADLHLVKVICFLKPNSVQFLAVDNLDGRFDKYTPPAVDPVDSDTD